MLSVAFYQNVISVFYIKNYNLELYLGLQKCFNNLFSEIYSG